LFFSLDYLLLLLVFLCGVVLCLYLILLFFLFLLFLYSIHISLKCSTHLCNCSSTVVSICWFLSFIILQFLFASLSVLLPPFIAPVCVSSAIFSMYVRLSFFSLSVWISHYIFFEFPFSFQSPVFVTFYASDFFYNFSFPNKSFQSIAYFCKDLDLSKSITLGTQKYLIGFTRFYFASFFTRCRMQNVYIQKLRQHLKK
jgi:hypothetical protein